jgi:hypothetical protein
MSTLAATYTEGAAGIWSLTCAECPLIPHAEALGQKAPDCMGGIATNMQGPIVMHRCKHAGEPIRSGKALVVPCAYTIAQP